MIRVSMPKTLGRLGNHPTMVLGSLALGDGELAVLLQDLTLFLVSNPGLERFVMLEGSETGSVLFLGVIGRHKNVVYALQVLQLPLLVVPLHPVGALCTGRAACSSVGGCLSGTMTAWSAPRLQQQSRDSSSRCGGGCRGQLGQGCCFRVVHAILAACIDLNMLANWTVLLSTLCAIGSCTFWLKV
jgi:hypothetical protein